MSIKMPNVVTTKVARSLLLGRKHSPTILFVGGVVGAVGATVSACKATLKLEKLIDDKMIDLELVRTKQHPDYSDKDRARDKTLVYVQTGVELGKLYAPALILGSLSIAALTGSHNILSKRNAGLTAAYAASMEALDSYRKRVVKELGEDKDKEFMFGSETTTEIVEGTNGPKKEKRTRFAGDKLSPYSMVFGPDTSDMWSPVPETNVHTLRMVQRFATDRLRAKGHLFLNDVYRDLGLDDTSAGAQTGWVMGNGDGYVDLGIWTDASMQRLNAFMTGREDEIVLDFNVDGSVLDLIDKNRQKLTDAVDRAARNKRS